MLVRQVIRRCLVPAAVLIEITEDSQNEEKMCCRPSELPIYTPEPAPKCNTVFREEPGLAFLEETIRNIRLTLTKYNEELQAYKQVGFNQFEKGMENVEWVVNYLQEENNTLPKAGAIGIGALTGLIFGLRGGFFKRTLYATTGAVGMAALCYPKEAAVYTETGVTEAKKYVTIAYNFIYGDEKKTDTVTSSEQVNTSIERSNSSEASKEVKDPLEVVTKSHDTAIQKSCHCPIGACLGHSEENSQSLNS